MWQCLIRDLQFALALQLASQDATGNGSSIRKSEFFCNVTVVWPLGRERRP